MKQKLKRDKKRRAEKRKKRPRGYIVMKKILLVEDRPQRQQNFLEKQVIDLTQMNDILVNCTDEVHRHLIEDIKTETIDWNQYSTIIIHRSGFSQEILDKLKEFCQTNSLKLVFFSGGISSTFYMVQPYEFLQLNSKELYTKNLKLFLETNENNLLQLAYGEEWEVNILLNKLEKINKFIEDNKIEGDGENAYYSDFSEKINIRLLQTLIEDLTIEEGITVIKIEEIERISKKILSKIKMKAILND
jgi:hypothetical protein